MMIKRLDNTVQTEIRTNLDEISFIRPILILLVVLYHSMAIHTGNWDLPDGCRAIPAYKAIGRLSYAFMLEAFVFVSGYVWAYQRETRGRKDSLWTLCSKKAQRLIVPTIIFGVLYILLFEQDQFYLYHIIEGAGHLWFLPMLFECFLISWCFLTTQIKLSVLLPILFIIGIFIPSGLPLRLSYTFYYLPFFLLGYYFYGLYDSMRKKFKYGHILVVWCIFFILYFGMVSFRSWLIPHIHQPVLLGGGKIGSMAVYALAGTMALITTSIWLTNKIKLSNWFVKLGSLCMGVYIFQQFILEIVYYHSAIPFQVPNWLLPLLGFVFALAVSLVLTYLIRSTKLGKSIL